MFAGLAASAAMLGQGCATAQNAPPSAALQPQALPFDPKTIPGFSEKILVSHHQNNYMGAVNGSAPFVANLRSWTWRQRPASCSTGSSAKNSLRSIR
jgi:hypothetical protein